MVRSHSLYPVELRGLRLILPRRILLEANRGIKTLPPRYRCKAATHDHIGIDFWLFRRRYQQGLYPMCGSSDLTHGVTTSGCRASNSYSVFPPFSGIAYNRSIFTDANAAPAF